jgi:hypothetical protein
VSLDAMGMTRHHLWEKNEVNEKYSDTAWYRMKKTINNDWARSTRSIHFTANLEQDINHINLDQ